MMLMSSFTQYMLSEGPGRSKSNWVRMTKSDTDLKRWKKIDTARWPDRGSVVARPRQCLDIGMWGEVLDESLFRGADAAAFLRGKEIHSWKDAAVGELLNVSNWGPFKTQHLLYTECELGLLRCEGDVSDVRGCHKIVSERNTTFLMRRFWNEAASEEPVVTENIDVESAKKKRKQATPFLDLVTMEYQKLLRTPSQKDLMIFASKCIKLLRSRDAPTFTVRLYNQELLTSKTVSLAIHCQHLHPWEFLTNLCMGERAAAAAVHPKLDEAKAWK